jgi:hypothetical protein
VSNSLHAFRCSGGLDVPIELPFVERDWRFGHYKYEGLQDPVSRFVRFIFSGAFLGRGKEQKSEKKGPPSRVPSLEYRVVPALEAKKEQEELATATA